MPRGEVTLESILRLYESRAYGDCWTLFRTLLDRLFHLHVIAAKNEFEGFQVVITGPLTAVTVSAPTLVGPGGACGGRGGGPSW